MPDKQSANSTRLGGVEIPNWVIDHPGIQVADLGLYVRMRMAMLPGGEQNSMTVEEMRMFAPNDRGMGGPPEYASRRTIQERIARLVKIGAVFRHQSPGALPVYEFPDEPPVAK